MRAPITVYGATGFTGRLVCGVLARRKVEFRMAGRDEDKLRRLAGSFGMVAGSSVDIAPLDDADALEDMASRSRVVLDCAGPFATMGRPVLDACLAAKAHFLDITGEVDWMIETAGRDAEAKRRKIAAVNAVGFDVIPTDVAAALAAEALGGKVDRVRIAICALGARPTQGTTRSLLGILAGGGLSRKDGEIVREKLGAEIWRVPFPAPIGPRDTMSGPLGDLVTADRTTGARNIRCFVSLPRRMVGAGRLASASLRIPGVRPIIERWVRTLPEGPSASARKRAVCAAFAECSGKNGTRSAWLALGDAYEFTAESAALAAILASSEGFTATGALSPVQAFGVRPLLDGLSPFGVTSGVTA